MAIYVKMIGGTLELRCVYDQENFSSTTRHYVHYVRTEDLASSSAIRDLLIWFEQHAHGQADKTPLDQFRMVLDCFTQSGFALAETQFKDILANRLQKAAGVNPYEGLSMEVSHDDAR